MELLAGDRLHLQDGTEFLLIQSGLVEVYAVSRAQQVFRKQFLMARGDAEAVYPIFDEMGMFEIEILAVDDTKLSRVSFLEETVAVQAAHMRQWLLNLLCLPWLRLLADMGDDQLGSWRDGSVLREQEISAETLFQGFKENEQIFAVLMVAHFHKQDNKFGDYLKLFKKNHQSLISETISYLMNEEPVVHANDVTGIAKLEEAALIIRRIAKALSMAEPEIGIAPEIVKKLDQLGLIRRLMQKSNIQLRLVSLPKQWYQKDSGVFFAYYGDEKELAALIPTAPDKYQLVTRARPEGIPITAEVDAKINRSAFICYAGLPLKKLTSGSVFKFIIQQCWQQDFRTMLTASMVAGMVAMLLPTIVETVFQDIVPIRDSQSLTTVTQVGILGSFTTGVVAIVRAIATMRMRSRAEMAIEAAIFGRLLALPVRFFRRFETGEMAQRIVGINAVKEVVSGQSMDVIFNLVFSFWSLLLMCWYSVRLTGIAVLLWLIYCGIMAIIYRRTVFLQRQMVLARNKTSSLVQQIFTGLSKFRIQGAEAQAYNLWGRVFSAEWQWNMKKRWQANYSNILVSVQPLIFSLLLYVIVASDLKTALEAGKDVSKEVITYAQFMAFQTAFTGFNTTLNAAIPVFSSFFTLKPHWENLQPILEELPESTDDKVDASLLTGSIDISHLTFAYREGGPNVLKDINLSVRAGEYVAVVGSSGCGKSTLIRLLLGFEQPRQGAIYYDGQDLDNLNLSSVRSQMGVVLQNGQLMSGDIFTNIVGTTALSLEDAWDAAEAAGIADDIRNMPMGMQTVISEGSSNISGGQRQRILIARALAAHPAVLVFDEATSALDNRTQAIVTESLKKLAVTRIVVAHRLSTIRECDRIVVLHQGKVAEAGNYHELLEKKGLFAALAQRQMA